MEKITIVIPLYQVENYIRTCVESLLNQTDENFRVIFVNDGTLDSSAEICAEYCKEYKNFKLIEKENGGLSSARNAGILEVETDFVMFLDSDDWISEDTIEFLNYKLSMTHVDVITFRNKFVTNYKQTKQTINKIEELISGEEAFLRMISNSEITSFATDKLYRVSLFLENDISFPEKRYYEDLGTVYKILLAAKSVYLTNKICYFYYIANPNSITATVNEQKIKDMLSFYTDIYNVRLCKPFSDNASVKRIEEFYVDGCIYMLSKLFENRHAYKGIIDNIESNINKIKVSPVKMNRQSHKTLFWLYKLKLLRIAIAFKGILRKV